MIMKKINNENNDRTLLKEYLDIATTSNKVIYSKLNTSQEGLTIKEAKQRLEKDGKNITIQEQNHGAIYFFLVSLKDEFVLILIFLSIINFLLGDTLGSLIIFAIALISAGVRFFQDYSIYKFNQKLK